MPRSKYLDTREGSDEGLREQTWCFDVLRIDDLITSASHCTLLGW